MTWLRSFSLLILSLVCFRTVAGQDSPDRSIQANVPRGEIRQAEFNDSQIFPGTVRKFSVYVPAQYDPQQPACLMVFMDGSNYAKLDGAFRVPTVFDNLIHQRAMPVTIAVFVDPGSIPATATNSGARSNRSFEYDSLGDRYSKFLIDELLPKALEGLNVSANPSQRAVGGISSGAICAFTVAWERPDQFGKVLSHIGSYTNIRGGWAYPGLVRKSKPEPKPIKVYLQEGEQDLNNLHGNWPLSNQDLAAALQFAGYNYRLSMTEGGHSGQWAGRELPDALRWLWAEHAESTEIPIVETKPKWEPHPDAIAGENVPQGQVVQMPAWESKVFADTIRDWSIYVPAQYKPDQPAAVMVFQDGQRMADVKGRWRVPIVFDNLIARGDMPPTIAVFVNPGHDKNKPMQNNRPSNRGYEYDSLGNRYAKFLHEELLPEVAKQYNISTDPNQRAIGGSSSGAICAFSVAWERPDSFRKVYSSVGSFTNLRGGNVYPALIRKSEPKPIRVYMADTSGDVDNAFGSWPWANKQMFSALQYMGYDCRFDWAEGYAHNADFGSSRFPDAMKWLWRNEVFTPTINTQDDLAGDLTLLNLLDSNESWEVIRDRMGFADALVADKSGNLYGCDMREPGVYRWQAATQSWELVAKESVSGLEFNADESLLYACQGSKNRLISIHPATGEVREIASGVKPNDLEVTADGFVLFTDTAAGQVVRIDPTNGEQTVVATGIQKPNGITISADGNTLAVSEYGGASAWMYRLNPRGVLDAGMPNMELRRPIDEQGEFKFNEPPPYQSSAKGDGMCVDSRGRYYITSAVGIQVFDPTGRLCGVIEKPAKDKPLTTCAIAGRDHDMLFVAQGDTIYARRLTVK